MLQNLLWASSYISYCYPNNNYLRGIHVCLNDSEICQEKGRQKSDDYNLLQCHMKSFCDGIYLDFNYIHSTQKVVWEVTCQSKANQTCFHAEQLPHITLNYTYDFYAHTQNSVKRRIPSPCLSVCPSAWKKSALTGRSFK